MDKTELEIVNGQVAQDLLNNELLESCFTKLIDKCVAEWQDTPPDADKRRDDAWRMIRAVKAVKTELHSLVTDGKFANKKVTDLNAKKGILNFKL